MDLSPTCSWRENAFKKLKAYQMRNEKDAPRYRKTLPSNCSGYRSEQPANHRGASSPSSVLSFRARSWAAGCMDHYAQTPAALTYVTLTA